jgi:hypothetical protein
MFAQVVHYFGELTAYTIIGIRWTADHDDDLPSVRSRRASRIADRELCRKHNKRV